MNPYENLPSSAFWRTGVTNNDGLADIHRPKWELKKTDLVVTMGSCFAQHIGKKLKSLDFNVPYFDDPKNVKSVAFSANYGNIYTVRQALQILQEADGSFKPSEIAWKTEHGYVDCLRPNVMDTDFKTIEELQQCRDIHLKSCMNAIEKLDVFIFTLGLSEAWLIKECGRVLPVVPGLLGGLFNPDKYVFKNFSFLEIKEDLDSLISLITKIRQGRSFKVLLTVSPVPLTATAEPRHVLVSSTSSKAILRAVADEVSNANDFVDYFPSYEIVTNPKTIQFNYEDNLRTVKKSIVDEVMNIFECVYAALDENAIKNDQKFVTMQSIDELGDVDCEDFLLETFSTEQNSSQSLLPFDSPKMLFFGNSHIAVIKNSLKKSLLENSLFAPVHFLENDPFQEIETKHFREFKFKNKVFKNVYAKEHEILILTGFGLFGDGIIRSFGALKSGYKNRNASNLSPNLPQSVENSMQIEHKFTKQIRVRLDIIDQIILNGGFKKIVWVVSPNLPESAARFRFGDQFVDSGIFKEFKRIYSQVFTKLTQPYLDQITFIYHDDKLYNHTGFVKNKYSRPNEWDIHVTPEFFIDGNLSEKILRAVKL